MCTVCEMTGGHRIGCPVVTPAADEDWPTKEAGVDEDKFYEVPGITGRLLASALAGGSYLELEEAEAAAVRGLIAEARTYGRPATWRTIYERGSHASTAS